MTQKEAEEILVAAGWVVYREMFSLREWVSPNGIDGVDIWKDDAADDYTMLWRREKNAINFSKIPSDLLLPKEVSDVLRHCS